ncbi:MAG: ABC transporter permease, partial [Vicinamibacteria bacterium]
MAALSESVVRKPSRLVLRPTRGWGDLRFAELWEYRELLYFLTWSHVKVRYKQAVFGAGWAIL